MNDAKYEPLSGAELITIYHSIGGKDMPNVLTYKELNGKSIDEILGPAGKAIILFMNSDNYGHWCALYRNRQGLNFFDSYGCVPDDQYRFVPKHMATKLNGCIRRLTKLLYNEKASGTPVFFNEYELQDYDNKQVATCGRWCVARVRFCDLSIEQFKDEFLDRELDPDDLVTELTGGGL